MSSVRQNDCAVDESLWSCLSSEVNQELKTHDSDSIIEEIRI